MSFTTPVGAAPRGRADPHRRRQRLQRAARWAAIALGAGVLALAFASYLNPDMAFSLMTQAWGCL